MVCTLVHRPGELGCVGLTEEARTAGVGVSSCETHPIDVTCPLLTKTTTDTENRRRFVSVLLLYSVYNR